VQHNQHRLLASLLAGHASSVRASISVQQPYSEVQLAENPSCTTSMQVWGLMVATTTEHVSEAVVRLTWSFYLDDADEKMKKNFLGEATLLAKFGNHPNVMGLLRVICQSNPQLVIIWYMPHGDLKHYLRE
jgi:hypothetical protein